MPNCVIEVRLEVPAAPTMVRFYTVAVRDGQAISSFGSFRAAEVSAARANERVDPTGFGPRRAVCEIRKGLFVDLDELRALARDAIRVIRATETARREGVDR